MITKLCDTCGEPFTVKPYREATARFCSFKCGGSWHAKTRLPAVVSKRMKGNRLRAGLPPANAFTEGNVPWNAGMKGIHLSPATEFIKGRESNRKVPVGTVTIFTDKNGSQRARIKIADPNRWQLRAVQVWEANFGPVPKGCVIHHDDRNSLNDDIDNLICMSRRAHINEHRADLERKG